MKYILAACAALFLATTTAHAAGIQISPAHLEFTVNDANPASKEIVVANPTADVQVFEVYADDFDKAITSSPKSFTLESGARKTVTITVTPAALEQQNQILQTNLSVVSKPLAQKDISVGAGAKLPVIVSFDSAKMQNRNIWPYIGSGTAVIFLVLAAAYIIKRRTTTRPK